MATIIILERETEEKVKLVLMAINSVFKVIRCKNSPRLYKNRLFWQEWEFTKHPLTISYGTENTCLPSSHSYPFINFGGNYANSLPSSNLFHVERVIYILYVNHRSRISPSSSHVHNFTCEFLRVPFYPQWRWNFACQRKKFLLLGTLMTMAKVEG